MTSALLDAVVVAAQRLPAGILEELARGALRSGEAGLLEAVPEPGVRRTAEAIVDAWRSEPEVSAREVTSMLRVASAAWLKGQTQGRVEVVMTGPAEPDAPTRSTEAVVVDLVSAARRELLLVTYAAHPYGPLLTELAAARDRAVRVRVVLETVAGAHGLLQFEPAATFAVLRGVELFHWPLERRQGHLPARMHAKVAIADREIAFVTSANLTGSAIESNLECGVLVHGGTAPRRLADHFAALIRGGVLHALSAAELAQGPS